MPGAPPDLTGAWRGSANGLPCTLRLQESPDGNVSGEATLTLGPTASSFRVAGKVKPDGTMNLRAVDGDLAMNAQFLGGKLRGTYKLASTPTPLAWSAERR
jgi:hypothetical protein